MIMALLFCSAMSIALVYWPAGREFEYSRKFRFYEMRWTFKNWTHFVNFKSNAFKDCISLRNGSVGMCATFFSKAWRTLNISSLWTRCPKIKKQSKTNITIHWRLWKFIQKTQSVVMVEELKISLETLLRIKHGGN